MSDTSHNAQQPGSNGHDPAPPQLAPDRDMLLLFVSTLFKHANKAGFVSFRIFEDNGKSERPVLIQAYQLSDHQFDDLMVVMADQAATWFRPAVFAPPVCTFKNQFNAKTDNIHEGPVLTVECDQAPYAARASLEMLLGAATIVSESGGEWINPETGEVENKAHLHWRLKQPAATVEQQAMLYEARQLATRLVGGDATAIPIVHPLRWPGSWHRKGTPKLARIAVLNAKAEIDLTEALGRLREVAEAAGVSVPAGASGAGGDQREASHASLVAQTLAVIPNDSTLRDAKGVLVHDWEYWNRIGMTIWASTSGSEEGRVAFHEWSAKAAKYDKAETEKRWQHYFRSPPTKLGFGSLVYRAREADPSWCYRDALDAALTASISGFIAQMLREKDEQEDDDAGNASTGSGGATGGSSSGGTSSGPPPPPSSPQPKPLTATAYEWIDPEDIPERDWLYGRLLIRQFVTATVAPGGLGKSSLVTAETLAQTSGRILIGTAPSSQLRVWLWNLEDPKQETQRKIQAAAKHYGLSKEDIGCGDRLFVDSGRDQKLVIAQMTAKGAAFIVRAKVDELVAEIKARAIDVVVIDPFVSCHEVPENDNTMQDMIIKEWGDVAERGNCAVHLVDHTRKMGSGESEVTTESSRGAKAKTDAARVVRVVNRMTKDQGDSAGVENHRLYFRTYNDKANLAPPADASDWFKLESVHLGNGQKMTFGGIPLVAEGDSVGVVTAWEWPDALEGVTGKNFEAAAIAIRGGKWRASFQCADWVGVPVAGALGRDLSIKKERASVRALIKIWLASGALVEVTRKDAKRNDRQYIEVAEEDD